MPAKPSATVIVTGCKAPHYYPAEQIDDDGNVTEHGVYAGMIVSASVQIGGDVRTGAHCIDVPEDATDEQVKSAIVAQYNS